MYSEVKHISYAVSFLCILLWLLSLLDFAQPLMASLGWQGRAFWGGQLGAVWPYFSVLFALLLLLLGLRFPTNKKELRSAFVLLLLSFALIFESFGLFVEHPRYSFVGVWNNLVALLLQGTASPLLGQLAPLLAADFLPLVIFGFWGPGLLALVLPLERFSLVHWIFCFNLLFFSAIPIGAVIFFRFYAAGLVFGVLCLWAVFWHIRLLCKKTSGRFSSGAVALFYSLLCFLLALLPSTGLFFQILFPRQYDPLYVSLAKDFLEVKLLTYTMFFLWFSFPVLFLFLFPKHKS